VYNLLEDYDNYEEAIDQCYGDEEILIDIYWI
jgi:hypothetical protein